MASHEMTLRLDPTDLRDAIDALLNGNRVVRMTSQYGECVTISKAAKMLGRSRTTIYDMIRDGRLKQADGHVDVVSIAEYLDSPKTANQKARFEKKRRTA